jgi:hypothetical protein
MSERRFTRSSTHGALARVEAEVAGYAAFSALEQPASVGNRQ